MSQTASTAASYTTLQPRRCVTDCWYSHAMASPATGEGHREIVLTRHIHVTKQTFGHQKRGGRRKRGNHISALVP